MLDARGHGPTAQAWSPQAVIELALADVQQRKAGWTRADLTAAINAALPDYLGLPDGADVGRLLDHAHRRGARARPTRWTRPGPATRCCPAELRLANGDSAYVSARVARCTPPRSTCAPNAPWSPPPRPAARRRCRTRSRGGSSTGCASRGIELGVDQAAAVRGVLTSGARVESLVGPAGTGKSFVVGALARAWTDPALHGGERRGGCSGWPPRRSPPTSWPPRA